MNWPSYDPCVVSKTINGKQFTTTWHVDDLKLSHVDKEVVYEMIKGTKSLYGNNTKISRVKKHNYLIMNINF